MRGNSNYFNDDTIVALSSALGGAIALVRVSGSKSAEILLQLSNASNTEFKHRTATRVRLISRSKKPIDDAVVTYFKSPNSFTGEDCLEISIHASAWVANELITEIIACGGRQALPGEFTFRAVRSGKLSLGQAQAIPELIESKNQIAAELALDKLGGLQNQWVREVSGALRRAAMLSEVGIDFSDQDIEELNLSKLKEQIRTLLPRLIQVEKSFERGNQIQKGVSTAIIGMPNAGKSSFFNLLLGEDRSIVSNVEGTTRDVVRESLSLKNKTKSITLRLSDTAGIRKSADLVESQGIERSKKTAEESHLILCIVDSSKPEIDQVLKILRTATESNENKKIIVILNKSDLVSNDQVRELVSKFNENKIQNILPICSVSGEGLDDVIDLILEATTESVSREPGELVLTHINHLNAVRQSVVDLKRALDAPEYELFAADIRQCLAHLSGLIGETTTDDILGKIFSEFCIGK